MSSLANTSIVKSSFLAEAVFASLEDAGHQRNHIKITNKGGFKKGYSNDVETMLIETRNSKTSFELQLNRDGIYDKLPEGLFHQTKGNSRVNSVQDAVEEHKQFKEEEKYARSFFAPLEQALFHYKADAESAERATLYDIQNGKLNEAFYRFWNISPDLPQALANRMLQLMPYSGMIKGDPDSTATALAYVLNREVSIAFSEVNESGSLDAPVLSRQTLGVDTVTGNKPNIMNISWICTIAGIPGNELYKYAESNEIRAAIDRFTELFIPIDIDINFDFVPLNGPVAGTYENILGTGAYL
ncbi:MAG TPA: hypothetical protein PKE30_07275 [Niabella sp.]|nr:hypothetical protein [Niabella sp.]